MIKGKPKYRTGSIIKSPHVYDQYVEILSFDPISDKYKISIDRMSFKSESYVMRETLEEVGYVIDIEMTRDNIIKVLFQ